jgi:hypothetical protein
MGGRVNRWWTRCRGRITIIFAVAKLVDKQVTMLYAKSWSELYFRLSRSRLFLFSCSRFYALLAFYSGHRPVASFEFLSQAKPKLFSKFVTNSPGGTLLLLLTHCIYLYPLDTTLRDWSVNYIGKLKCRPCMEAAQFSYFLSL